MVASPPLRSRKPILGIGPHCALTDPQIVEGALDDADHEHVDVPAVVGERQDQPAVAVLDEIEQCDHVVVGSGTGERDDADPDPMHRL